MAENLDWKFDGCVIGASGTSASEPRGNYYNNDESTYGWNGNKYGLLYNYVTAKYLNESGLLPTGWRVPTYTDFENLAIAVGGTSTAGTKLKSTTGWSGGNGDGSTKFNATPSGSKYYDNFQDVGFFGVLWTFTEVDSSRAYDAYFTNDTQSMRFYSPERYQQYNIRLVKDAT
jgi:uncharacterized protein (TIGR02145 family)